jgi:hypothetical protein
VADAFPPGCCHYPLIEPKLLYREVLMISSLQLSARRQEKDKATCEHYGNPVWVVEFGKKYRARCLGCRTVGPVVNDGPLAARQALRNPRASAA